MITKFRGKDDNGKWQYGSLVTFKSAADTRIKPESCDDSDSFKLVKVDSTTVGQLIDFAPPIVLPQCNWKQWADAEIYEGDVVKTIHMDIDSRLVMHDVKKIKSECELTIRHEVAVIGEHIGVFGRRFITRYVDDKLSLVSDDQPESKFEPGLEAFTFEILGNIHDNPKLLDLVGMPIANDKSDKK